MEYIIGAVTGLLWGALVAWLNSRISKKAIEKNSTKSIKEITEELNFPNQSFLGKYFKEHVGMTPSAYRKS